VSALGKIELFDDGFQIWNCRCIVQELVKRKVDLNKKDQFNGTALKYAFIDFRENFIKE
jgi:hypothetical protein